MKAEEMLEQFKPLVCKTFYCSDDNDDQYPCCGMVEGDGCSFSKIPWDEVNELFEKIEQGR